MFFGFGPYWILKDTENFYYFISTKVVVTSQPNRSTVRLCYDVSSLTKLKFDGSLIAVCEAQTVTRVCLGKAFYDEVIAKL